MVLPLSLTHLFIPMTVMVAAETKTLSVTFASHSVSTGHCYKLSGWNSKDNGQVEV